jgi:hypothetical protein
MVRDLQNVVDETFEHVSLNAGDVFLDIGCNDATMLDMLNKDIVRVGIDPALNLSEVASEKCDHFINDYFTADNYYKLNLLKPKVITSIAMFYDLENPHSFVSDVKKILDDNGIWVIQFTDLVSMLEANAFDNICHEHLEYYSLVDLMSLMYTHDLKVFDVSYNKVNGGSIRVYVCHKDARPTNLNVHRSLQAEIDYLQSPEGSLKNFSKRIENVKNVILTKLKELYSKGSRIALLGASTKGNTLLQYFGLDNYLISFAAEVNKDKFGLKTVGTNIPIINEKDAEWPFAPDYYFIPIWHFATDIISRKEEYLNSGGKFIVPMPEPMIIEKGKEGLIWTKIQ